MQITDQHSVKLMPPRAEQHKNWTTKIDINQLDYEISPRAKISNLAVNFNTNFSLMLPSALIEGLFYAGFDRRLLITSLTHSTTDTPNFTLKSTKICRPIFSALFDSHGLNIGTLICYDF